jgi:hypothetical protein
VDHSITNSADHCQLSVDYSIQPHIGSNLPHILTAPFLYWSWAHIEGNSIPFLVLHFLAAYRRRSLRSLRLAVLDS